MPILLLVPNSTGKWPIDMFGGVTGASDVWEKIWTQWCAQFFLLYTTTPRFSHLNKKPGSDALQTSFLSLFRMEIVDKMDTVDPYSSACRALWCWKSTALGPQTRGRRERWREVRETRKIVFIPASPINLNWTELVCVWYGYRARERLEVNLKRDSYLLYQFTPSNPDSYQFTNPY